MGGERAVATMPRALALLPAVCDPRRPCPTPLQAVAATLPLLSQASKRMSLGACFPAASMLHRLIHVRDKEPWPVHDSPWFEPSHAGASAVPRPSAAPANAPASAPASAPDSAHATTQTGVEAPSEMTLVMTVPEALAAAVDMVRARTASEARVLTVEAGGAGREGPGDGARPREARDSPEVERPRKRARVAGAEDQEGAGASPRPAPGGGDASGGAAAVAGSSSPDGGAEARGESEGGAGEPCVDVWVSGTRHRVPREALVGHSSFFRALLEGPFAEGAGNEVRLGEGSPGDIARALAMLGEIHAAGREGRAVGDAAGGVADWGEMVSCLVLADQWDVGGLKEVMERRLARSLGETAPRRGRVLRCGGAAGMLRGCCGAVAERSGGAIRFLRRSPQTRAMSCRPRRSPRPCAAPSWPWRCFGSRCGTTALSPRRSRSSAARARGPMASRTPRRPLCTRASMRERARADVWATARLRTGQRKHCLLRRVAWLRMARRRGRRGPKSWTACCRAWRRWQRARYGGWRRTHWCVAGIGGEALSRPGGPCQPSVVSHETSLVCPITPPQDALAEEALRFQATAGDSQRAQGLMSEVSEAMARLFESADLRVDGAPVQANELRAVLQDAVTRTVMQALLPRQLQGAERGGQALGGESNVVRWRMVWSSRGVVQTWQGADGQVEPSRDGSASEGESPEGTPMFGQGEGS